jgi:hypothetical protein
VLRAPHACFSALFVAIVGCAALPPAALAACASTNADVEDDGGTPLRVVNYHQRQAPRKGGTVDFGRTDRSAKTMLQRAHPTQSWRITSTAEPRRSARRQTT